MTTSIIDINKHFQTLHAEFVAKRDSMECPNKHPQSTNDHQCEKCQSEAWDVYNLTPHPINVGDQVINPSGIIARAVQSPDTIVGSIGGLVVYDKPKFGEPIDLPNPISGVIFIVSLITAQAAPNRRDLAIVHGAIRGENGQIIGFKGISFPNRD